MAGAKQEQSLEASASLHSVPEITARSQLPIIYRSIGKDNSLDVCYGPYPLCKVAHCPCDRSAAASESMSRYLQRIYRGEVCCVWPTIKYMSNKMPLLKEMPGSLG